jgi:twitching motility two-component system response regulator PilG
VNEVRGGPQGRKRQCILIVEDSTTQRRYLRDGLWDYELLWAVNARDALVLAFTKRPDLILLDVNIEPPPGGDDVDDEGNPKPGKYVSGLDVCRQLKKSVLKNTPVLVLTAKSGFLPRIRGRLAHANEYLTKPLEMDVLREHIYKYLGSSQVRARLARLDRHAPQAKPPTSAERGDRRGDVEQPEAAS